jgi:hypothetical protein
MGRGEAKRGVKGGFLFHANLQEAAVMYHKESRTSHFNNRADFLVETTELVSTCRGVWGAARNGVGRKAVGL